jgi:hypothetical protein
MKLDSKIKVSKAKKTLLKFIPDSSDLEFKILKFLGF